MFKRNNNRNNFVFAIASIVILLASSTLTGSPLGKVSLAQSFGLQHQENPLKIWTIGSSPTNNNEQGNATKANVTKPIAANVTRANMTRAIANVTRFNPFANVTIQKEITNIRGPVHINFVNSYWTSNTAQDQFVAGTESGREQLINSITGQNEFVTGTESALSENLALQPIVKQEVAPGEGPSLLAVTLVNEGFSAITGVTSSLELPQGFEPLIIPCCSSIPGSNPQTALSSYDGVVEPGNTFTLYFGVKVLGNAQVGKQYNSELNLGYVKVTEIRGKLFRSEPIAVPFTIPGRVILDLVSYSPPLASLSNVSLPINSSLIQTINLIPGAPNVVKLSLRNDGSATARGVIVNIAGLTAASVIAGVTTQVTVASNVSSGIAAQPTSSSTVILGSKVFNIGIVPPGGSKQISLVIYPSIAAAGTVQTMSLTLSFDDAYGNRQNTNQLVGLQILPISPQSGLTVSPSLSPSPSASSSAPPSASSSAPPSASSSAPPSASSSAPPSASSSASSGNEMLTKVASVVHSTFNASSGNTNNNTNTNGNPPYPWWLSSSPSPSSSTSPATSSGNEMLTKVASFFHSTSNTNVDSPYPATAKTSPSSGSLSSPIQIADGKIQNVTFAINNDNAAASPVSPLQNSITDLAVSLVSKSSLVRILGPSSWNLPTISSGSGQQLTTQVFASTSLMDNPVVFNVTIKYIQNGHQVKTASFDLGAIVVGDIQLRVNNLGISYIRNTPTLVGSILNEGNTPAQFASVEMLQQGQGQSQTQTLLSSTSNKNLATILIPSSSQYLGSIAPNSPMPFNIPLQAVHVPITKSHQQNNITTDKNEEKIPSLTRIALNSPAMKSYGTGTGNNTAPGIYPVLLKITYIDDLKNSHGVIVDSPLQIKPTQPEGTSNQGNDLFGFLIGAFVIAIGVAAIFIRKWLRSERNENLVSKTYKKILSRMTTRRIEGGEAVIHTAHPPDEKKAGAPFSPI